MSMICFRCKKEIFEEENYYKMIEMDGYKEVKTDYVHRSCWDSFLEKIGSVSEAKGMLKGLKKYFQKAGIFEADEVVIQ